MKNTMSQMPLVLALFALSFLFAAPAHAVQFSSSAITFLDSDNSRNIDVFVKGDDNQLVSNHYDGTTWTWIDHGLPPGATSITGPRAITYVDDAGHRRIYVFALDNTGHLVVRFHKGPGYGWQWSQQGGPAIFPSMSLSATTFIDDNGVRRIYAFGFTDPGASPFQLWTNYWNGDAWNWTQLPSLPSYVMGFTQVTNYIGNDGRRRMDVFCAGGNGDQVLMRNSWVEGAWSQTNLGGHAGFSASAVNYLDSSGYRKVDTFVHSPESGTIWDRHSGGWSEIGKPATAVDGWSGDVTATTYFGGGFPRIDVFSIWDKKLYQRRWVNLTWQPWADLGKPASSPTGVDRPFAITYLDPRSGNQHNWVFVVGSGRLYANRWNGTSWQWYNLGNP
jgi:hypothetical protein